MEDLRVKTGTTVVYYALIANTVRPHISDPVYFRRYRM